MTQMLYVRRKTVATCDENPWQLATKNLFPTNYRRYCDDDFKFKKKKLHEIWYYHINIVIWIIQL
jgi:hypothetical protein